jgi:hypothetical protein
MRRAGRNFSSLFILGWLLIAPKVAKFRKEYLAWLKRVG